MKRAVIIRHVPFEDLGSFAEPLATQGYHVNYLEAGIDNLDDTDAGEANLLIILGGPIGANDDQDYPFLKDEIRIIEHRLQAEKPILGVCLGSQLLARALGARIFAAPEKEIGWAPLTLTAAGRRSPLSHLAPERTAMLHWHGDTFDLPSGAVRLASTPLCENQAFQWGNNVLALQFHPEVTTRGLERWFIGHILEIHATQGISVASLRTDTTRFGLALEVHGPRFFRDWLDQIERENESVDDD